MILVTGVVNSADQPWLGTVQATRCCAARGTRRCDGAVYRSRLRRGRAAWLVLPVPVLVVVVKRRRDGYNLTHFCFSFDVPQYIMFSEDFNVDDTKYEYCRRFRGKSVRCMKRARYATGLHCAAQRPARAWSARQGSSLAAAPSLTAPQAPSCCFGGVLPFRVTHQHVLLTEAACSLLFAHAAVIAAEATRRRVQHIFPRTVPDTILVASYIVLPKYYCLGTANC
eukprot:6185693-Pleurochrysis_carterae.AAC.3